MIRTTGIFYDGIASNPQRVEVILNKENAVFLFDTAFAKGISWDIRTVRVQQIDILLEIRSGNNTLQSVQIEDPEFAAAFNTLRKKKGSTGFYQKLLGMDLPSHIMLALVILGVISLVYVFVMPWATEKAVMFLPKNYENFISDTFFDQYMKYTLVDSDRTDALRLFASQLNLNNTKEINFTVINSETVNAFALPDGNIILFTGIIDRMQNYEELAGLIGHEVAHVNNRHSIKMMCRNLTGYIFLSVVLSDVNGIMSMVRDNIHTLQSLTYSWAFEREADREGMEMLISNQIDPKGMSALFTRLQTNCDGLLPEFLSSHPVTEDRMRHIDKMISKNTGEVQDNTWLRELFLQVKNAR